MMATTHAVVGTAIAVAVRNPVEAGILIVVSHYLLDLIPHWDFGTDWKKRSKTSTGLLAIADTLFAYGVSFVLFGSSAPLLTIFLASSLANLPDWLIAPYFMFFSTKEGYNVSHGGAFGSLYGKFLGFEEKYIHTKATFIQGISTQITTILFFLLLLRRP